MSFDAGPGWLWASSDIDWALTRDNGSTLMRFYRYGGSVVPAYCADPPPTIPITTGNDIISWLDTVKGLHTVAIGRSVGPNPAWQLDLVAVDPPVCPSAKQGIAALWTIDGAPPGEPEALSNGDRMRVYLIELPDQIVIATVKTSDPATYAPFLLDAEQVFSSLAFD